MVDENGAGADEVQVIVRPSETVKFIATEGRTMVMANGNVYPVHDEVAEVPISDAEAVAAQGFERL